MNMKQPTLLKQKTDILNSQHRIIHFLKYNIISKNTNKFFLLVLSLFLKKYFTKYTKLLLQDEIFLRHSTTRYDLIEVSMAIWSGFLPRLMECSSKCSQEPNCLSLVYDKFYASCHLFNVIYESDDNGDINYWVLETRSTRWGKHVQ